MSFQQRMKSYVPFLALCLWMIIGLFFGSGGITKIENSILVKKALDEKDTVAVQYKGVIFKNKAALISKLEEDSMNAVFFWTDKLPEFSSYIITACSFSLLGSIIWCFIQIALKKKDFQDINYISHPILGILTGFVVLGISYVIPNILSTTNGDIKPTTLMFFCLFCGIYLESFYNRLTAVFSRLITQKNEDEKTL